MLRQRRVFTTLTVAVVLTMTASSVSAFASPSTDPSSPAATAPKSVELIPAFDNDLPKGSAPFAPGLIAGSASLAPTATTQAAAAPWVCSVYASDPWKSGIFITGDGTQTCTGTGYAPAKINVTIQAYKALGFWTNRKVGSGSWSAATQQTLQPYYDCTGDGTYTYRIITDAYAQGGVYTQAVQSLNYLRVSC